MSEDSASLELSAAPTSAVLTVSPDGTITSWSSGAQRLYGWTRDEALGRPLIVLVPADRRAEFEHLEQRLRDGEQLDGVDTIRVAKDGRRVEVELHVMVLHDEAGRITGSVRVHHDRAPLRRAQEALLAAERGLDDGFLASPVPQARLRPDGVVLAVNPAVEQLLGMPAAVLIGIDGMGMVAAADQEESADVLTRLATGAAHFEQREITLEPAAGEPRRVLGTTTTVREGGQVVALHTSLQDVTDLRAAQERERAAATRFDALVQSMPVAVWTFDCAGTCTSSRGAALAGLGLADGELVGVDLLERDRDHPEPLGATLATLAGESTTLRRSVGGRDWESHCRPLRDDEGRVVGGIGIAVDVTERAAAEREVAANEARLRALLRNAADVVIVLDIRGRMLWVSPAVTRVFGHDHVAMARRLAYDLNPPEDRPVIRAAWDRVARTPGGTSAFSVRVRHADGGYRWTDQVLTNLLHDPDIAGIVVNIRDVTRHRAAEQEVQRLALHDRMTGLANRALLLDRTEQALTAGRRTGEQTGLVVVDVLGMTAVNELVGQAGGDVVLRTVADRLASAVLGGDSVARLGADDFAVLVEDLASGEDLRARASTLVEAGQGEVVVNGVPVPVVLRVGSAMTPAADAGALLAAAERSLGTTTSRRVPVGSATVDEDDRRTAELVAELRTAIGGEQLRLHFQPLLGLRDGEVVGAEGLVRWEHPERGLLLPGEFIPLAETSGLVVPLGAWVLRAACAQASAWHAQGLPYAVGANLSPRQLVGGDVVALVRDLLAEFALPPDRLVLEVTESTVMDDPRAPLVLSALSGLGVHLALDDFGTGYSSLTYLKRFPVDAIKIDRSFVSGLGRDADDEAIVASVVSLARAIGKTVVAEGVETAGQLTALRALGVEQAQGFFWSAALPADELAAWLAARPAPTARPAPGPAPAPTRSRSPEAESADERRILALHGEGASLHTIAAALNAAGRRTPNGPRWTTRTVARVVAPRAAPARSTSQGVGPAAAATRRTPVDLDSALGGDLRAVVELASLAPSVHNTQPWRFTWDGRVLSLYDDAARALPVLDPTGRERVLSCGCALQHARLALNDLGYEALVDLLPDPADEHLLARLTVGGEVVPGDIDRRLVAAVPRRVTDRDPFDERPVPAEAREAMRAAAEAEGAWLRFVGEDGQDDAVELQVLLSHADDSQRRDVAYLEELAAWRREQEAEGIPSRALPTVPPERRGSSWVPRDFDARSRSASEGGGSEPPVPEHPSVFVLGTRGDDRADWLTAGQALARVLLQATADGLAAQPLTQVLEVPVLRGRMRHALGVLGHPQMLLRVGYGSAAPTSSRRPAEQILTLVEPT